MKVFTLTLFAIFGLLSARGLAAQGTESFFAEAGLRAGVDAEKRINLVSYELFGEIDMDWSWNLSDSLRLNLDIETAIGGLYGESEHAVYGRMAPIAKLHLGDSPVTIVLSSGPSFYSKDTFDDYDIGGHFQFTTSVGLNWSFDDAWAASYRFQHTSNANLTEPNPGLDMHTVSIAYTF